MTGYPNYIITNDGRVYNSQRNKFLVPAKNEGGYMSLSISDGHERKSFSLHRLVALLFINNPNDYLEVNHIDFDKELEQGYTNETFHANDESRITKANPQTI